MAKNPAARFGNLSREQLIDRYNEMHALPQIDNGVRVSSATSVSVKTITGSGTLDIEATKESWKDEAYYYYETMAEPKKVIDITARGVSACELNIARRTSLGTTKLIDDDPELNQLLFDLEGPAGDYHQIIEQIATNLQITGDGYLIAEPVKESGSIIGYTNWEFVSVDELSITGMGSSRKIVRNASGGVKKFNFSSSADLANQALDEDYYIVRCWRRSPRYSQLSTSALKANLRTLKLLSKLQDLINAIVNTQLTAGILIVPEDASFGPEDDMVDGGEMAEDQIDPLTDELLEYLAAAVEDRSSAASLVPLILRIKAEYADQVRLVRLSRDLDEQTSKIREELYERLAIGLDAPPETLQGKSNLNNWTGYQIDAEFASKHIIPLGHLIADFLTRGYLWPILKKRINDNKSNKRIEDLKRYRIVFNPRNIVARIDAATLAIRLYEHGILNEEATVKACGFEVTDLPSTDERRQALIIDLFKAAPKTLAPLLITLIDGLEHLRDELPQSVIDDVTPESEREDNRPTTDQDARGEGPRRTREDGGPGSEPNSDRINDDRGPGGDREDNRGPNLASSGVVLAAASEIAGLHGVISDPFVRPREMTEIIDDLAWEFELSTPQKIQMLHQLEDDLGKLPNMTAESICETLIGTLGSTLSLAI